MRGAGTVAGLVLAAGEGRRFGGPKALALLDGVRLVDRAAATLADARCDPVVVVEGAAPLAPVPGATVVNAGRWREGMGASLRAGLAALPDDVAACVVLLVDTPWLTADAVRAVVGAWYAADTETEPAAAVATYHGKPGHPVLLASWAWPEVAALAFGDVGARAWLRTHRDDVLDVDCTGLAEPYDVDRPTPGIHLPPG